jgi:hypothetical protein
MDPTFGQEFLYWITPQALVGRVGWFLLPDSEEGNEA